MGMTTPNTLSPAPAPASASAVSLAAQPAASTPTARVWHSHYGDILIETHADGSVSVNGKTVQTDKTAPVTGAWE
jgi:hypothetical protein